MPIPRYERQVRYEPVTGGDYRAQAHQELAQSLGSLSSQLMSAAATQSSAEGEREGAIAGGKGKPEQKSDITAYGQAYNRAAMQAYKASLDADMRETLANLAEENRNDSTAFQTKASEYFSGLTKDIDPTIEQSVRDDFALRSQAYRQNIAEGERRRARLEMQGQLETDTRNLTDSIYRSARDGLADIVATDRLKLAERVNAETISDQNPEGLITPGDAQKILANIDSDVKAEYTFGEFLRTLQNDGIEPAKGYLDRFTKTGLRKLEINPDQRDALVNKMEAEIRGAESVAASNSAVNKSLFGQRVQDEIAMHRDGVEPPSPLSLSDFVATYGPDEGAFRFNELQSERQYGLMVKQAVSASPEEQVKMLEQMQPQPGEGYQVKSQRFDQMRSAIAQVNAAREKDPGAYALRQPGMEKMTPDQMAQASLAIQNRWGIANPKPLPNAVSSQIVKSFSQMPGKDAAAQFLALEQQYGAAYPEVYSQLVGDGLPSAFVAIGAGMQGGPAELLAEVSNIDIKELKNNLPDGVAPKDITKVITSQANDFNRSLVGMPGSEKTYSAMTEAAERLAYRYVRQNGQSAESAATQAWNDVLGSRYEFVEKNGGVARIPNHLPVDDISDNFDDVLNIVTPYLIADAVMKTPGYDEKQLLKMIKSRGYFVTTEKEDGVYLFMDGRPVPGKAGLVKFTWDQILDPNRIQTKPIERQQLTTGVESAAY